MRWRCAERPGQVSEADGELCERAYQASEVDGTLRERAGQVTSGQGGSGQRKGIVARAGREVAPRAVVRLRHVEMQGSGEEATFSNNELDEMLAMGKKGIGELIAAQRAVLASLLIGNK